MLGEVLDVQRDERQPAGQAARRRRPRVIDRPGPAAQPGLPQMTPTLLAVRDDRLVELVVVRLRSSQRRRIACWRSILPPVPGFRKSPRPPASRPVQGHGGDPRWRALRLGDLDAKPSGVQLKMADSVCCVVQRMSALSETLMPTGQTRGQTGSTWIWTGGPLEEVSPQAPSTEGLLSQGPCARQIN